MHSVGLLKKCRREKTIINYVPCPPHAAPVMRDSSFGSKWGLSSSSHLFRIPDVMQINFSVRRATIGVLDHAVNPKRSQGVGTLVVIVTIRMGTQRDNPCGRHDTIRLLLLGISCRVV